MNTNSQPATNVDIRPTHAAKQPTEVSHSVMKNWQHAVGERKGTADTSSADAVVVLADSGLAQLPESMQAQLLQERFRQAFDAEGGGGADAELPSVDAELALASGLDANQGLIGSANPQLSGRGDALVDENAARVALAEQSAAEDSVSADLMALDAEDESVDDDLDDSELDESAGSGGHRDQPIAHQIKLELPLPFAPRDGTDYSWIEKFTDRMLIEVEARVADRNLSIQLANDVIPNATLILSRTNGRWQLNANTSDDDAAHGIEDAEQALAARFAARGLGDISVNVEHTRTLMPAGVDKYI